MKTKSILFAIVFAIALTSVLMSDPGQMMPIEVLSDQKADQIIGSWWSSLCAIQGDGCSGQSTTCSPTGTGSCSSGCGLGFQDWECEWYWYGTGCCATDPIDCGNRNTGVCYQGQCDYTDTVDCGTATNCENT